MNNKVFLYLAVFCISIDSYFRLRGIAGIGFLLIYLLTIKFEAKFNKTLLVPTVIMLVGFIVYTSLAFLFPNIYLQIPDDRDTFFFKVLDRLSLIILALMIFWSFNKVNYALILRKVALFHIFYLLIQFVLYYGVGLKFDLLGYLVLNSVHLWIIAVRQYSDLLVFSGSHLILLLILWHYIYRIWLKIVTLERKTFFYQFQLF